MNRNWLCGAVALLAFAATAASASTTYVAIRAVGTGFVNLSITTDDTIGVLGTANILDWDITVTKGLDTFNLQGPGGLNNSGILVSGPALTTTATDLLFDFSSSIRGVFAVQTPNLNSGLQAWCVQTTGCFDAIGPAEGILPTTNVGDLTRQAYSGNQIIASVAGPMGVPEPTTWALMIGGFGMAGTALRGRRRIATS